MAALRTDVDWLKTMLERLAYASAFAALGIIGIGWGVYNGVKGDMTSLAVGQQTMTGKLDTFDARLMGKMELLQQRLDSHSDAIQKEPPAPKKF